MLLSGGLLKVPLRLQRVLLCLQHTEVVGGTCLVAGLGQCCGLCAGVGLQASGVDFACTLKLIALAL